MHSLPGNMAPLTRSIRRGVHQLVRDRSWGMTLLLLTGVMVLVQLLLVFFLGVRSVSGVLTARSLVPLEIIPSATEQQIQELYAYVRNHPSVAQVEYVTGQKAYELQSSRDPELIAFLEEYNLENPFPDTFAVQLQSFAAYDSFSADLQQNALSSIIDPSYLSFGAEQKDDVHTVMEVTHGMETLSTFFMVIAVVLLFFVVTEWVSRTVHRREHELLLMHYMGAEPLTVTLPFAVEMALLLIAALFAGTALVLLILFTLPLFMPSLALEASFTVLEQELWPLLLRTMPLLLLMELVALPVFAFVGTVIGSRKKLPTSFGLFA